MRLTPGEKGFVVGVVMAAVIVLTLLFWSAS